MVSSVFGVACKLLVLTCEIWFPGPGLIPDPLHWEHGVLAMGPPGKSQFVVCLFFFFRIKQGEHVVVEKRKEGQTWKGDLLWRLGGRPHWRPGSSARWAEEKFAALPSLGLVRDWLLASKMQGSGLQASLQRKIDASAYRKALAANAGRRSPSGHWLSPLRGLQALLVLDQREVAG